MSKPSLLFACLAVSSIVESGARADGFDRVKCDADPAKALRGVNLALGKRKVPQIEAAHSAIKLKFDGADGVAGDDVYGTRYWHICDHEYVTLHDMHSAKSEDTVRDVLAVPEHPAEQRLSPPSRCKRGAGNVDDVLALMPKGKGEATPLKAWRVDKDKLGFVAVPTEGLRCSSE